MDRLAHELLDEMRAEERVARERADQHFDTHKDGTILPACEGYEAALEGIRSAIEWLAAEVRVDRLERRNSVD